MKAWKEEKEKYKTRFSWSDCSSDLFELIADEHNIAHVSCFTINPRGHHKYPVNIARIAFKGQELPDSIYIGGVFYNIKPYIPPQPLVPKLLEIRTSSIIM